MDVTTLVDWDFQTIVNEELRSFVEADIADIHFVSDDLTAIG